MPDFVVPGTHPVSIDGHPYLLDLESNEFAYETIPLLNPQLQNSAEQVSESSLNPEGLWRRSQASWHKGAGQTYMDKEGSDAARFRSSLGIDPWTEGEISLLPDATRSVTNAGSPIHLTNILGNVYVGSGTTLNRYNDIFTPGAPTAVDPHAGEGPFTIQSMVTYGLGTYIGFGVHGIHAGEPFTHYSDTPATVIGYAAGRLMSAHENKIYNITTSGAAASPLFPHPDGLFRWVGFAEASGYIYAAGASLISDKSYIYKTSIKPDGTALDVPSVAASIPEGEVVRAIYGYLNFILIGTDNGVRFAVPRSDGNLEVGALMETGTRVAAFEGQGPFVWFAWTNYDADHTGLGRLDLRTLVEGVAPAYATDLMIENVQGTINSIVTIGTKRVFSVAGYGVCVQRDTKVPTGTINSGWITYDLPEEKEARFVDVRYRVLEGSDATYIANQTGAFQLLRTNTAADTVKRFSAGGLVGDMHELRHVFSRSSTDNTLGPVMTRHTLKSQVKVNMGAYWYLPLILATSELTQAESEYTRDIVTEFQFLADLAGNKSTVTLKILDQSYTVTVEDVRFVPTSQDKSAFNGTMLAKLKVAV